MPTFMKQTWHHYSTAPHRLMFLPGMIQLVLTVIYWGIELAGRYTTWWSPLTLNVPGFALRGELWRYKEITTFRHPLSTGQVPVLR
ncbi:MAG: hypothetical protein ACQETW_02835 [Pseudomonadota bacterium]